MEKQMHIATEISQALTGVLSLVHSQLEWCGLRQKPGQVPQAFDGEPGRKSWKALRERGSSGSDRNVAAGEVQRQHKSA